jgi:hypothetical protein
MEGLSVETVARYRKCLFRRLHHFVAFEVIHSGCILIRGDIANVLGNTIELVTVMWKKTAVHEIYTRKRSLSVYFTSEGQITHTPTVEGGQVVTERNIYVKKYNFLGYDIV